MIGFLTEIGKRITSRWFTAILIPGLLLVVIAGCAVTLGHAQALDSDTLIAAVEREVSHASG